VSKNVAIRTTKHKRLLSQSSVRRSLILLIYAGPTRDWRK